MSDTCQIYVCVSLCVYVCVCVCVCVCIDMCVCGGGGVTYRYEVQYVDMGEPADGVLPIDGRHDAQITFPWPR